MADETPTWKERAEELEEVKHALIRELSAATAALAEAREALRKCMDPYEAINALQAAEGLCEIYFNIAAEALGEDEVRKRRDAALAGKQP